MDVKFYGKIKDGVYTRNQQSVFDAYCKGQSDGDYCESFEKVKQPKTPSQMAYYYAVIVPIAFKQMKRDGNDTFVVKVGNKFKEVKLTEDVVDMMLKEACLVESKARMSKDEAMEFLDKCIRWCARYLGCVIPDPDPNWKSNEVR